MRFRIEYIFVAVGGVAQVIVRQLDPGNFSVGAASTLGGVPIHAWLDQPRALTSEGHPDTTVFGFVLVNSSDRDKLTLGQVVELISTCTNLPSRLQDLYEAANEAATEFSSTAKGVFDPCGLILEIPPSTEHYWCTPKEVHIFARTGGDGVHYSYFTVRSSVATLTPIVMTLPASDAQNYVIAESFDEFFGLGYYIGWFALEQAVYNPDWAEACFSTQDTDADDHKVAMLSFLRVRLEIQHIPLCTKRISALTKQYAQHIVTPPLPSGA